MMDNNNNNIKKVQQPQGRIFSGVQHTPPPLF